MIKRNAWTRWKALNPEPALMVGEVISQDLAAGTSQVQILGGSLLRVQGTAGAVGLPVFVRDGKIEGDAPTLPTVEIEL